MERTGREEGRRRRRKEKERECENMQSGKTEGYGRDGARLSTKLG